MPQVSGKWQNITSDTAVPKNAVVRSDNTYSAFITAALRKGVPIQMAIARANTLWPATQRQLDPSLEQLPVAAPQTAAQAKAYNQVVGLGAGKLDLGHAGGFLPASAELTLGRADQGRDIHTAPDTPILASGRPEDADGAADPEVIRMPAIPLAARAVSVELLGSRFGAERVSVTGSTHSSTLSTSTFTSVKEAPATPTSWSAP